MGYYVGLGGQIAPTKSEERKVADTCKGFYLPPGRALSTSSPSFPDRVANRTHAKPRLPGARRAPSGVCQPTYGIVFSPSFPSQLCQPASRPVPFVLDLRRVAAERLPARFVTKGDPLILLTWSCSLLCMRVHKHVLVPFCLKSGFRRGTQTHPCVTGNLPLRIWVGSAKLKAACKLHGSDNDCNAGIHRTKDLTLVSSLSHSSHASFFFKCYPAHLHFDIE